VTSRPKILASLLLVLAPAGCLLDWDSLRPPDGGLLDASGDVLPTSDADTDGDSATTDASDGGGDACALQLLVNEVQADGTQGPSDEFVEIRNGAPCGGSLLNWGLRYSSSGGSSPSQLWTGQAGDTIGPAGPTGYVILGGYAFQTPDGGKLVGRISTDLNGTLAKGGGGVGLFDPQGTLVDGVAYATITTTTHPFIRPPTAPDGGPSTPAPNPPSGKSIARTPDGQNTDTNAVDFQIANAPTPGFAN
jgi:hypothetical protein